MDSFAQKGFVPLPLKPQPVSETSVSSWCPRVPVLELISPRSTLPGTEQSLQPVFPPCAGLRTGRGRGRVGSWGVQAGEAQPYSATRMAPCGCLRLAAIHPTSFSSCRAETKDSLSAFKIMAIHYKTKYFFPSGYSRNLTWNFKTQVQIPHSPAPHSQDLNIF